jgi:ribosomal protein S18 acetylase RimI-like enzyme
VTAVLIRPYLHPHDYAAVRALWEGMEKGVHVGRSDSLAEIEKKASHDPDLFLVAEADNAIIGSVIGGYDGRRGLIYHLAVNADFRNQGIASRLMDEVEFRLRAKGCLKCYLLVLNDNDEAARYYEKRGWGEMKTVRLFGKELS